MVYGSLEISEEVVVAKFSIIREETASDATNRTYQEILNVKHLRFAPNFFKTLANSPDVIPSSSSRTRASQKVARD